MSAGPTAPMSSYNSALPTLIDLVIRALGPAMPDRVAARRTTAPSPRSHYAGRRPDTGAFWQCHDSGFGGWGALYDMDGPGTVPHQLPRRHPADPDRSAGGELSVPDRELQPAPGLRRPGTIPWRPRAGAPLSDAGAVPDEDAVRTHASRPPWGINDGHDGKPVHVRDRAHRRYDAGRAEGNS